MADRRPMNEFEQGQAEARAARDAEWREALRRWWAVCGRCGSIAEACKCTEGDAVRALLAGGTRG